MPASGTSKICAWGCCGYYGYCCLCWILTLALCVGRVNAAFPTLPFRVIGLSPANGTQLTGQDALVVIFNQAVVALGADEPPGVPPTSIDSQNGRRISYSCDNRQTERR